MHVDETKRTSGRGHGSDGTSEPASEHPDASYGEEGDDNASVSSRSSSRSVASSRGSAPCPPGYFDRPVGVAVRPSDGKVLVVCHDGTRVQLMTQWGAPLQVIEPPSKIETLLLSTSGDVYSICADPALGA